MIDDIDIVWIVLESIQKVMGEKYIQAIKVNEWQVIDHVDTVINTVELIEKTIIEHLEKNRNTGSKYD